MLAVPTADEPRGTALAVNEHGLLLIHDDAGTWLIRGSADGLTHFAGDRLLWLLPLLERSAADISAALPHTPLADSPLPALVRFALTVPGEYWPAKALRWLESGWPIGALLDVLAAMKDNSHLSQPLRHRALRLWLAAIRTSEG